MDLGGQTVIDFPQPGMPPESLAVAPLRVITCRNCGLAQLAHSVNRDLLYRNYFYRSSSSDTMKAALDEVVAAAMAHVTLISGDHVLDIGANDGWLLSRYPASIYTVGMEPSDAIPQGTYSNLWPKIMIHDYFNYENVRSAISLTQKPYKIITSIAMFYDVDTPLQFMADVADLLAPDGVWINQMNYLPLILQNNAVDFFSHEHVTQWTLKALMYGLEKVRLQVFRVETFPLNGGTARFYIQHARDWAIHKRRVEDSVDEMLRVETEFHVQDSWARFQVRMAQKRQEVRDLLHAFSLKSKQIFVLGASTRGNSLLQYYGLDVTQLPFASERDPAKVGRVMAGTNIPIISEEEARKRNPAAFLVLPYSYRDEIIEREQEYLNGGGRLIFPLPTLEVISNTEVVSN